MTKKETDREPELKKTNDGSHTLFSVRFDQYYHNPNGAVSESRHVFFKQNGLLEVLPMASEINILEIGFGTGLNLLLLVDEYLHAGASARITYHSIEGYPISSEMASRLNYQKYLRHPDLAPEMAPLFASLTKGHNRHEIVPGVTANIFYGLFEEYHPSGFQADYIFHDAFSPEVNEELWSGNVFRKLKTLSRPEVLLSTYCAASKARGALCWAGWKAARVPGALGKREMTLAALNSGLLAGYKRVNEERLARRYEEDDF